MANITDSQGVKVYVADTQTLPTSVTETETLKGTAQSLGCIQSLGEITKTRTSKTFSCLDSNETTVSVGSIQLGTLDMSFLFDAGTATSASNVLINQFEANDTKVMIIELNDSKGNNPTYITFTYALTKSGISIQKDDAVMFSTTIAFKANPVTFNAS